MGFFVLSRPRARVHRRWRGAATAASVLVVLPGVLGVTAPAAAVPAAAPSNTVRPKIAGTPETGATLSVSSGTWDPAADSYRYDWQACDPASISLSCRSIGTDQPTLTLSDDELDERIRVRVTAVSTAGSTRVNTSQTRPVTAPAGPPPVNTGAPSISGAPAAGSTLTADPGTWTGSSISYRYDWAACTDPAPGTTRLSCTDVEPDNDVGRTLTPDTSLNGSRIRVRVTATNPAGAAVAQSSRTTTVGAPANTAAPTITGTPTVGEDLTADPGTWAGKDATYTYTWQACTTATPTGADCTAITSGTNPAGDVLTLSDDTAGSHARVVVTATNQYGARSAKSITTTAIAEPTQSATPLVDTGDQHTCVVSSAATARCFGDNRDGQATVPTDLGAVTQVSAGARHSCAVTTIGGTARCWGSNSSLQSTVPADLGSVTQVSAGGGHSCAVTTDGTARCWGNNISGGAAVPIDLGSVTQISTGYNHTCAIRTDGSVRCWGRDANGQTAVPADLGTVAEVSTGGDHTCAITTTGTARCWGWNGFGQTGVPFNLGAVTQVSGGTLHTCAITTAGIARCWGDNTFGQTRVPTDLGTVTQISAALYHTCAITTAGNARCWGTNDYGQATVPNDLERTS